MTGKAGVAIATSGPGVSNLVTGLATANSEGDPVVALGGAVATSEALKQVHQTMDAVSIFKPVTKYSVTAGASDAIGEVMANAFRAAESGRPGAAFVNLPKDIMALPCAHDVLPVPAFSGLGVADAAALAEAARLINQASNPVVLLGLLARKPSNGQALQTFMGRNKLPGSRHLPIGRRRRRTSFRDVRRSRRSIAEPAGRSPPPGRRSRCHDRL
jgi:acetolactate synthase-1/2/3 large subunit